MEALEDLLSDTDCEGHLNFRPTGQFSFAAIRRQLETEGVEEEELEGLEDDMDVDELDEQDLDEQEDLEDYGDSHLTRGLWDISALGIGAKYAVQPPDDLDEDEESCKGQQIPCAVSEAPTALPDDAVSRAPKRPSLKEEEEFQEDGEADDVDFLPSSSRDPECAKDPWDIPSLRIGLKQDAPQDDMDEDEGGLLAGNSVLLPSCKGQQIPSVEAAEEATKVGANGATKRPFLKKGSRARSTLPGNTGPLAVKRPAPVTPTPTPSAQSPATAATAKKEPRKPFRFDAGDPFGPDFEVVAPREHQSQFKVPTSQKTASVASPLDDKVQQLLSKFLVCCFGGVVASTGENLGF